PSPPRVELLADTIDALRRYDPTAHRSPAALRRLAVLPLATVGDRRGRLLDYLPASAPVVVDAPRVLDTPTDTDPGAGLLRHRLGGRQLVELDLVGQTSSAAAGPTPGAAEWALDSHAVPQFNGRFNRLQAELERWRAEGFRTRLV